MPDTPSALPELPLITPPVATDRAKRIYATMRWAGVIAVTEMSEGFESALRVVEEGPERFMPDDEDFGNINATAVRAIAYIENGA